MILTGSLKIVRLFLDDNETDADEGHISMMLKTSVIDLCISLIKNVFSSSSIQLIVFTLLFTPCLLCHKEYEQREIYLIHF